jgi:phosphohistidine phosphatase
MKTLLLTRHGKSSWNNSDLTDHQRPLKKRGLSDSVKMATHLQKVDLRPDIILSSDAVRALSTCNKMKDHFAPPPLHCILPSLYLAGLSEIQEAISMLSSDISCTMLIGHNPGWEVASAWLSGESVIMTTCNVVALTHSSQDWSCIFDVGSWNLSAHFKPRELDE